MNIFLQDRSHPHTVQRWHWTCYWMVPATIFYSGCISSQKILQENSLIPIFQCNFNPPRSKGSIFSKCFHQKSRNKIVKKKYAFLLHKFLNYSTRKANNVGLQVPVIKNTKSLKQNINYSLLMTYCFRRFLYGLRYSRMDQVKFVEDRL